MKDVISGIPHARWLADCILSNNNHYLILTKQYRYLAWLLRLVFPECSTIQDCSRVIDPNTRQEEYSSTVVFSDSSSILITDCDRIKEYYSSNPILLHAIALTITIPSTDVLRTIPFSTESLRRLILEQPLTTPPLHHIAL